MWKVLLEGDRSWSLVDEWCDFLQASHSGRAVSKDTWTQLLDFIMVRALSVAVDGRLGCFQWLVELGLRNQQFNMA